MDIVNVAGVGLPPLLQEPESMLFKPFRVFRNLLRKTVARSRKVCYDSQ